eukprot:COSAG01_NODE_11544_length_1907_cov_1.385509_1_plen_24_part_10
MARIGTGLRRRRRRVICGGFASHV